MKIGKILKVLGESKKKLDTTDPYFISSFKDKVKVAVKTLNTAASKIEDFSTVKNEKKRNEVKNLVNNNIDRIVALSKNVANIAQKEDISKLLNSIGIKSSRKSDYANTIMNEFGIVNAASFENFISALQAHCNKKGADIDKFLGRTTIPEILNSCKEMKPLLVNNLWQNVFNIRGGSVGKGELLAAIMFKGGSLNHAPSAEKLSVQNSSQEPVDNVNDVKGDLYILKGSSIDIAEIKAGSSTQLAFDLRYANEDEARDGLYNYMFNYAEENYPNVYKKLLKQDKNGKATWFDIVWKRLKKQTQGFRDDFFNKVKYLVVFSGKRDGSVLILTKKNFKKFLNKEIFFQYPDMESKHANSAMRYGVSHTQTAEKFDWTKLIKK